MNRTRGSQDTFSIEDGKLNAIWTIVQANLPDVMFPRLQEYILADWPEGTAPQAWLDEASPREIADWAIEGLRNW